MTRAWFLCLLAFALFLLPGRAHPAEARNVRLVGTSDLQGRDSLQIVLKGNYAYIGHHRGEAFAHSCQELRRQLYIVDATEERNPIPVAIFKVPDEDYCRRGGRFGPHQFAETRDGEIIGGTLLYVAYFNAGLRVVDIADPYHPQEAGFYVPDTGGSRTIQTNDVDLDKRGLIYITDRAGNGLHVLEYTGKR